MLITLDLPPGLYRQGTKYQSKGRWYEAQLVRFLEDTVRPVGGWSRLSEATIASLYARDTFTADPGNISLDYTTSAYVSDIGFGGWDVATPADYQLEPDPSTHLKIADPTGSFGMISRNAIEYSDFASYMDVKWTGSSEVSTGIGMYVRGNDYNYIDASAEGLLFQIQLSSYEPGLTKDTYDASSRTDLSLWTADTGETYDVPADDIYVTPLRSSPTGAGVAETARATIQAHSCVMEGTGAVFYAGHEVYYDVYIATVIGHYHSYLSFFNTDGGFPQTDYYALTYEVQETGPQVYAFLWRYKNGYSSESGGNITFPVTFDTWVRIGLTIVSENEYTFWYEPGGGGSRTVAGTFTFTPAVQWDYVGNAAHVLMGFGFDDTNTTSGGLPAIDNLTHFGGGVAVDQFRIKASRVYNGSPYDLSADGGWTEKATFPGDDWSDGIRFGVDIEGDEAKAWYQEFEGGGSTPKTYLDWEGLTAGDPLPLDYENPAGVTDDYNDATHQHSAIFAALAEGTAGTEVYEYAYQALGFTGPIDLEGVPRGAMIWEKGATGYLAFGTHTNLYVYTTGYLYDITPSGFTVDGAANTTTDDENSGRYGKGPYGKLTYGVGQQGITTQYDADIWHMDTFTHLVEEASWVGCMCPNDNVLYEWNPEWGGDQPAKAITTANGYAEDAPTASRGVVVTPERYIVILGENGDHRRVAWAKRETIDIWTPTADNDAGWYILDGMGRIMRGIRGRGETVIWTDVDVFAMTYIGGQYIFGFERRGFNCGLIAPLAVAAIESGFVWMGLRGFYIYDGYARALDCPIQDAVFQDIDSLQRIKISAVVNQQFGEVWWFYPSISQDPGECDRFVIWNYRENLWSMGELERTCGINASASQKNPVMLSPQGWVYQHEMGWEHRDESGDPMVPYVESGPVELGQGDQTMHCLELIPDEKTLGDVEGAFYSSFYPMEAEILHGPYTLDAHTSVRLHGRQVRVRLEEERPGDWRVGKFRFEAVPGGLR